METQQQNLAQTPDQKPKKPKGSFALVEDVHVQLLGDWPGAIPPGWGHGRRFRYRGRWVVIVGNSDLEWYVKYVSRWTLFREFLGRVWFYLRKV